MEKKMKMTTVLGLYIGLGLRVSRHRDVEGYIRTRRDI